MGFRVGACADPEADRKSLLRRSPVNIILLDLSFYLIDLVAVYFQKKPFGRGPFLYVFLGELFSDG